MSHLPPNVPVTVPLQDPLGVHAWERTTQNAGGEPLGGAWGNFLLSPLHPRAGSELQFIRLLGGVVCELKASHALRLSKLLHTASPSVSASLPLDLIPLQECIPR